MPVGYLVSVALVTAGTAFALRPVTRPPWLGTVSFYLGLVFNELPFVALAWLLAGTLGAAAQDDLGTPVGSLALGLALVTTGGLLEVIRRARRARRALDAALEVGLGAGWRARLDPTLAAGLRRRPPWALILFAPFWLRRRDVERIADLSYGDAGAANLLDVYRRRGATSAGAPVLIHFHGGSFKGGHKSREARPLLYHLASRGWVCVSANYRLRPEGSFPEHLIDVKHVLAWVRAHASEYGADASTVFVAGSSAGGHLAAMAALTANDPRFQPGFEDVDTSLSGAVCLYGYYGEIESHVDAPSSPLAYVGPDSPPMFIAHGDIDPLVRVEGARALADRLCEGSSNPVVYAELPGAHHSFDLFHSIRFESVIDAVEAFAASVRSRAPRGG